MNELEVLEAPALQMITRAEVDMQISTAKKYPRSLSQFQSSVMEAVQLDPETAESCVYYRPVGKKRNPETGRLEEEYAEGPSIRMAEIVASCFGNIRAGARITERTDRYITAQGVCHDLEKNVYASVDVTESTVTKDGVPFSERMRVVVGKAAMAKAYRDAVFKVVPRAFLKKSIEAAKRVAAGDAASIGQRREKVKQWLAVIKIPEERMFSALGIPGWEDLGIQHLEIITGLKTAIKDGEIKAVDAFPEPDAEAKIVTSAMFTGQGQKEPEKEPVKEPLKTETVKTEEKKPETTEKTPETAGKESKPDKSPHGVLIGVLADNGIDQGKFLVWAQEKGYVPPEVENIQGISKPRLNIILGQHLAALKADLGKGEAK